ncbi:HI1506-related protein [Bradyrhizobium sp. 31Argb]|uniref:hypothetical protein n=1 Tax=Bradyrhizobium sp. 31Argb TaxID=3141247 RepID=UPI003748E14B
MKKPKPTDSNAADQADTASGRQSGERQPSGSGSQSTPAEPRAAPAGVAAEFVSLSFPLPAGIPDEALNGASIVVKAKLERGRRRAGRGFTREQTVIPYPDLHADQIDALAGDPELSVSLRLPKAT